jgi:hypothetical protein
MSIESITVSNVMVRDVKTAKESQTAKAILRALMKSWSLVTSC